MTIDAVFDGKTFVPTGLVSLPIGTMGIATVVTFNASTKPDADGRASDLVNRLDPWRDEDEMSPG